MVLSNSIKIFSIKHKHNEGEPKNSLVEISKEASPISHNIDYN